MSESESMTRLVMKLAPTVDVTLAGLKAPLQYRMTREVLPTPWAPRTTILASREDMARLLACLLACLLVWLLACLDCLVLPYRRVWLGSVGRACLRETYLVFGAGGG